MTGCLVSFRFWKGTLMSAMAMLDEAEEVYSERDLRDLSRGY